MEGIQAQEMEQSIMMKINILLANNMVAFVRNLPVPWVETWQELLLLVRHTWAAVAWPLAAGSSHRG